MTGVRQLLAGLCLLLSMGAAGQDSIGRDDFRYLDTTTAPAAEEADEEEITTADTDLEGKVRMGAVPHAAWDEQVPGKWNDGAQSRLSIRKVPAGAIQQLRGMKALQYAPEAAAKQTWAHRAMLWIAGNGRALRHLLFWLLGILLAAVVVLFLQQNDIPLFRWARAWKNETSFEGEAAGPDDYEGLARAAIAAGNFREAVRIRYLQTLQALEKKELIAPGKDKTNMDYVRELAATGWHQPFAHLTLHYEYVWYGKLPVSNGQFAQLDEKFAAFKNSLS